MLCPALQDAVVVNPQLAGGELRCPIVSTAMTRTPTAQVQGGKRRSIALDEGVDLARRRE
jgi:hypothetical protein